MMTVPLQRMSVLVHRDLLRECAARAALDQGFALRRRSPDRSRGAFRRRPLPQIRRAARPGPQIGAVPA